MTWHGSNWQVKKWHEDGKLVLPSQERPDPTHSRCQIKSQDAISVRAWPQAGSFGCWEFGTSLRFIRGTRSIYIYRIYIYILYLYLIISLVLLSEKSHTSIHILMVHFQLTWALILMPTTQVHFNRSPLPPAHMFSSRRGFVLNCHGPPFAQASVACSGISKHSCWCMGDVPSSRSHAFCPCSCTSGCLWVSPSKALISKGLSESDFNKQPLFSLQLNDLVWFYSFQFQHVELLHVIDESWFHIRIYIYICMVLYRTWCRNTSLRSISLPFLDLQQRSFPPVLSASWPRRFAAVPCDSCAQREFLRIVSRCITIFPWVPLVSTGRRTATYLFFLWLCAREACLSYCHTEQEIIGNAAVGVLSVTSRSHFLWIVQS